MFRIQSIQIGRPHHWVVLAMIVLGLLLSACGGAAQSSEAIAAAWVGTVAGTDAFIGIASNGTEVMAYVCDGQSITQWFHGDAGNDQINLSADTAKLQAQLTKDAASGSVTLADGQTYTFEATRAAGDSGLYRSEETIDNEAWVGGWIVLSDGQLRGAFVSAKGAIESQTSLRAAAKFIDPDARAY